MDPMEYRRSIDPRNFILLLLSGALILSVLIIEQSQKPPITSNPPYGKISPIPTQIPEQRVCTMEAKQCPDGSWVSRTGPNCEFTPCLNVSPTIPPQILNYSQPSTWKNIKLPEKNISFCLPPKWEWTESYGTYRIVFKRDPDYQPDVAYIANYEYKGGSRREEYLTLKLQYEQDKESLKKQALVSELTINTLPVLKISIPSFPEALVFVLKNRLYEISLSDWHLVNSSQTLFNKDIYTMIGCMKPT